MAKLFIEESTLTAIGDAIREKTEKTELLSPTAMPEEIRGIQSGGGKVVLRGDISFAFGNNGYSSASSNSYANTGTGVKETMLKQETLYSFDTADVTNAAGVFRANNNITEVPFDINVKEGSEVDTTMICAGTGMKITKGVNINGKVKHVYYMYGGCPQLVDLRNVTGILPGDTINKINCGSCCYSCYRLRWISPELCKAIGSTKVSSSSYTTDLKEAFRYCHSLEEIIGLGVDGTMSETTPRYYYTNAFNNTFGSTYRLRRLTFETNPDGTPVVCQWRSQTIDLSTAGSGSVKNYGFTTDTQITDDATYAALKNHPDRWTTSKYYSSYDRTSAVETINSLPDTSAYVSQNSTWSNTIKFAGGYGEKTDAGAINTMTAEEIAVATAKGWTVSFV